MRPSATTSGTAPRRVAITGVPQAMDSIITRPNGSSQSIGKSVARAFWSRSTFVACVVSPRYSASSPSSGFTSSSKYACSACSRFLPASLIGKPASRAISIARCAPLSGLMPAEVEQVLAPLLEWNG